MIRMTPLVVEVDGRVLRLEGDGPFRIGRSIEADVVITAGSASRQHAEIRAGSDGWVLVDAGSQFGTFVDGRPISEHPITDRIVVSCGPETAGSVLTIHLEPVAPAALAQPSHAPAPPPIAVSGDAPTAYGAAPPPPAPPAAPAAPSGSPFAPPEGPPADVDPPAEVDPPGAPADFPPPAPTDAPAGPASPPSSAEFAPPAPGQAPYAAGSVPPPPGATPPAAAPPDDPMAATQTFTVGQGMPGGPVMPPSGPDLLLVAEGREHRFRHPTHVTIGRNPDSTVVLTDQAASRQHGQITPVAGGWVYGNISGEGTFLDGRRVTNKRFDERIALRLGHPVAGPEITLVPILSTAEEEKRFARKRRNRVLRTVGVVAAALVVIAGIIVGSSWFFTRGSDDGPTADPTGGGDTMASLTTGELDDAKAATVRITAESSLVISPSTEVQYSGSGSIISDDGLILTNAHVAAPSDDDLVDKYEMPPDEVIADPEYLTIEITDPETGETEPTYRAEVVSVLGDQDAAVLQIVGDEDGDELEDDLELPSVPLGESADVALNDPVTVLGFPGVASNNSTSSSKPITVTDGKISTILDDLQEFDTTARISGGNSGGMAINNDAELIGVPSYGTFDGRGGQSNRIKMIDALKELIEEAEDSTS